MFDWLTDRRRARKLQAELLAAALAKLEESNELNRQAIAVCERWARHSDAQLALLAESRAEAVFLRAALIAPKELRQFIAEGCSEAQALALASGRATA